MSRRDSTSTCSRIQVAERNLRPESQTVNITSKVIDCHGQTQAHLERSTNGVWSIHSTDNHDDFTVKFDDALFRNILASKEPWNYAEWNTPSRINILLELLHWESKLSAEDDFKFELFRCTRRISREFEMLPSSLYVRGLMKDGNHPKWGGGFSDIWKGKKANGDPVCLKVLRVFTTEATRRQLFKEFSQEALVWSQLKHPNVLPFLGTNVELFPESYCLTLPWCSNGNVMDYLRTHPEVNKMGIISNIFKGLAYLHTQNPPVVHGDLKGANILVSDLGQCYLADFGLAGMMSTLQTLSSTGDGTRGSTRWMAPELLDYRTHSRPSTSTDMYSLGCTVFEIVTGAPPFSEIKLDYAVFNQVINGYRPSRPAEGFSDGLWGAVEKCWVNPNDRQSVTGFIDELWTSPPIALLGHACLDLSKNSPLVDPENPQFPNLDGAQWPTMVVLPLHAANHAQFYLEAMSSESTRFLEWGYILFQVTCDDHKLRSVLEEVIRLMENLKVDQINDSIENRAAKLTIELDKLFTVEIKYFWIDWALELFRSSTMRSVPFRDVPFRLEVQSKVSQPGRNCWDLSKFPTIMDLDRREQYNYSKRFLASHAPGSEIGSLGRVCLELAKRSPFTEIEDPWLMSRDGLRWPTMAVLPIHAAYHAQFYLEAMAFEPTRFLECEEHIRFQVQCDDHKLRNVLEEVIRLMENLNSVDQMNGSIGKRAAELHSELEKLFAVELKDLRVDWALEMFRSSKMRSVPVPSQLEVQRFSIWNFWSKLV